MKGTGINLKQLLLEEIYGVFQKMSNISGLEFISYPISPRMLIYPFLFFYVSLYQ